MNIYTYILILYVYIYIYIIPGYIRNVHASNSGKVMYLDLYSLHI